MLQSSATAAKWTKWQQTKQNNVGDSSSILREWLFWGAFFFFFCRFGFFFIV
jgi:hypothetical protein